LAFGSLVDLEGQKWFYLSGQEVVIDERGGDAIRKQGLSSAKPKRKETGCKRQTYQIRVSGIHQNWEKISNNFYWMNKCLLGCIMFCLNSKRNNKLVGRNKTKRNNNRNSGGARNFK
jgi:hypothetical protein